VLTHERALMTTDLVGAAAFMLVPPGTARRPGAAVDDAGHLRGFTA
jgi:hypothetical protein